jgi:hypothetical protein
MLRREAASFADAGVASDSASYLGPVTQEGDRLIRRIEVQKLPAILSGALFRRTGENAWSTPESPPC